MKVYLNRQPKYGPWGGGAKTVNKLVKALIDRGHEVIHRLEEGIDVIFCIDPRPNQYGELYDHFLQYRSIFKNTKIVHRVGDIGTHSKPELTEYLKFCLNKSDYFVFPSTWAKETIGFSGSNYSLIHNAPMSDFYLNRNIREEVSSPLRIVTHHWSTNPKKGFHLYQELDKYAQLTNRFEFNYIGQKPAGVYFKNYTPPIDVGELSKELPKYDIYLTASEEEAGANHVLEALACGLPVVYTSKGGSIVEYCNGYGKEYEDFSEMIISLDMVSQNYSFFKKQVLQYSITSDAVVNQYCAIIEDIVK